MTKTALLVLVSILYFAPVPTAQAQSDDSAVNGHNQDVSAQLEANKALVRRFVEEVQNEHNIDAVDELFSPDYAADGGANLEDLKTFLAMVFAAFPDMRMTIHDQIAEGQKVVTHKTFTGTHMSTFRGVPATGKELTFEIVDMFTVVDGQITGHWVVADNPPEEQLGIESTSAQDR